MQTQDSLTHSHVLGATSDNFSQVCYLVNAFIEGSVE